MGIAFSSSKSISRLDLFLYILGKLINTVPSGEKWGGGSGEKVGISEKKSGKVAKSGEKW